MQLLGSARHCHDIAQTVQEVSLVATRGHRVGATPVRNALITLAAMITAAWLWAMSGFFEPSVDSPITAVASFNGADVVEEAVLRYGWMPQVMTWSQWSDANPEIVDLSATDADSDSFEYARCIIYRELAKYSLRNRVNTVWSVVVCNDLRFSGIGAAGTFDSADRTVFISYKSDRGDYLSESYLAYTLHCEVAGLLVARAESAGRFKRSEWMTFVPERFAYGAGGVDAIKTGKASTVPTKQSIKAGLVHPYAGSSPTEDAEQILGLLMTSPDELALRCKMSLHIAQKANYIIDAVGIFDDDQIKSIKKKLASRPCSE